jgi:glycerol-3-phosphate acyltransferase PlsY
VARRLGLSERSAAMAGVFGAAGQCWPVTLGFSGGRGISAFMGAACAIDRRAWAITLVPFIVGSLWHVLPAIRPGVRSPGATLRTERSRSVPLGSFIGVLTFPLVLSLLRREPALPALLLSLVIIVRRLTAPLPDDVLEGPAEEGHALVYRLLYDRNTAA